MKHTKRFLALGLSVIMAMSLTACGSASNDETNKPTEDNAQTEEQTPQTEDGADDSSEGDPVTISFWNSFTGADGDMLVDLVNRFNEENEENITVDMDISADFDSQLSTAFAAGTGPTMILSSSAYRFTYGDYMQDVSDVFDKTNLDKSDFIQSYLDYCSEGSTLYFVPFQIVGYYMYWNKDLFEAAGLDPETPPATWDEWQSMAEKITDESKNVYGSGISYDYAYQIAHIMQRFGGLAVVGDNGSWKVNFEGNSGYADFLNMYKNMIDNVCLGIHLDTLNLQFQVLLSRYYF